MGGESKSYPVNSAFYRSLGDAVRTARETAGMTQAELAQQVGVSRPSLTNMELGRQRLLVDQLVSICEATGTEITSLLRGGEAAPEPAAISELDAMPRVAQFLRRLQTSGVSK